MHRIAEDGDVDGNTARAFDGPMATTARARGRQAAGLARHVLTKGTVGHERAKHRRSPPLGHSVAKETTDRDRVGFSRWPTRRVRRARNIESHVPAERPHQHGPASPYVTTTLTVPGSPDGRRHRHPPKGYRRARPRARAALATRIAVAAIAIAAVPSLKTCRRTKRRTRSSRSPMRTSIGSQRAVR